MLCILHSIKYHGSCLIYLAFSFPVKKRTGKNRVEQLKLHPLSTIAKVRMQWCLLLISRVHLSNRRLPESPGTVRLLCICRYDVSHIYIYMYSILLQAPYTVLHDPMMPSHWALHPGRFLALARFINRSHWSIQKKLDSQDSCGC